jgi:hypothetical protein
MPAELRRPAEASTTSWCSGHNASANASSSGDNGGGAGASGWTAARAGAGGALKPSSRCNEIATSTISATMAPASRNIALRDTVVALFGLVTLFGRFPEGMELS